MKEKCRSVIELAERNAYLNESARICLKDSFVLYSVEMFEISIERAIKSLVHSVGVFHEDYSEAKRILS